MPKTKRSAPKTKKAVAPRLLIVCHNHPAFFPGGTEILAYNLFQEWQSNKEFEPYFLAATSRMSTSPHPGTAFQSRDGAKNEFLFWSDSFDYFHQSQAVPSYLYTDFAEFLRNQQPDIVHFHHTMRMGLEAIKVVRTTLPHAKIVYTLHDFIPICHRDGQMVRTLNEELCDNASPARCHQCFPDRTPQQFKIRDMWVRTHFDLVDQFLSPSDFLRQRYIAWGIPATRISVIRNGTRRLAVAPARARQPKSTRNRLAFFGQISPYKGLTVLLEAMKTLHAAGVDCHLDIYGSLQLQPESFKENFMALVEECKSCVTFHGAYTHDNLPKLMSSADWVIVPSTWWENAPLVIDEALYHRRPVICSDIGGMAEKIRDGQNGLLFRAGNAADLADTIHRAVTTSELWGRLVKAIVPPPLMSDCARDHATLYRSLLR